MKRYLVLLLVVWFALLISAPVYAQDVTPEVTAAPTAVVVEPPPTFINADTGISVSTLAYGVIIAVLSGGTLAVVLTRFGSNKANLDALERLFQSTPPETQQMIRERFESLEEIAHRLLDIADRVTDGEPNEEPSDETG